ncbi:MAG: hypothetical protein N2558_00955 [Patescibacteria group bacterium]|nr:hypothetical protein [Patescibacteria group bacterium]
MKILIAILVSLLLLNAVARELWGCTLISYSAQIKDARINRYPNPKSLEIENIYDTRVIKLRNFLTKHNSPLAPYAEIFVKSADKHNIDWRLVPAITGVESSFGKRIPPKSYNAYGWANGKHKFESWESSIEHVTKTLREKYYEKGATTIEKIGRKYAPPSSTWSKNVRFFMNQIDQEANNGNF